MFGHQDDNQDQVTNDAGAPVADGILSQDQATAPVIAEFNPALPTTSSDQPGSDNFTLPDGASEDATAALPTTADEPLTDASAPADDNSPVAPVNPDVRVEPLLVADNDDLLTIKQQALTQLTPLVDQLDQSPEEKFRTTMMMIQAADNKDLVKTAYDAAQAITDEKVKAQALLDIVNEINYFTQHSA